MIVVSFSKTGQASQMERQLEHVENKLDGLDGNYANLSMAVRDVIDSNELIRNKSDLAVTKDELETNIGSVQLLVSNVNTTINTISYNWNKEHKGLLFSAIDYSHRG